MMEQGAETRSKQKRKPIRTHGACHLGNKVFAMYILNSVYIEYWIKRTNVVTFPRKNNQKNKFPNSAECVKISFNRTHTMSWTDWNTHLLTVHNHFIISSVSVAIFSLFKKNPYNNSTICKPLFFYICRTFFSDPVLRNRWKPHHSRTCTDLFVITALALYHYLYP